MNPLPSPALPGRVISLHLHPPEPGTPLQSVDAIEVITGKGISGDIRYFDRRNHTTGEPSRRHISLIEREQVAEHAAALGLEKIRPGAVRANIETSGINLVALVGKQVEVGEALLLFYEPRTGCKKMDAVCMGLRELTANNQLGIMAEIVRSGKIRVGDSIRSVETASSAPTKP
jgi:MOSC domain-containing protein YiiM